jgi:hypothetical protein
MNTVKRFAFTPKIVRTWRNTKALIFMQSYLEVLGGKYDFQSLSGRPSVIGDRYCLRLGLFSYEFRRK